MIFTFFLIADRLAEFGHSADHQTSQMRQHSSLSKKGSTLSQVTSIASRENEPETLKSVPEGEEENTMYVSLKEKRTCCWVFIEDLWQACVFIKLPIQLDKFLEWVKGFWYFHVLLTWCDDLQELPHFIYNRLLRLDNRELVDTCVLVSHKWSGPRRIFIFATCARQDLNILNDLVNLFSMPQPLRCGFCCFGPSPQLLANSSCDTRLSNGRPHWNDIH